MARTPNISLLVTVSDGLAFVTVDQLKKLLPLLPKSVKATRKAELVSAIATQLTGKSLQKLWQGLTEIEQAVVAEAVHVTDGTYAAGPFIAKYGQKPNWGTYGSYSYRAEPTTLQLFFLPTSTYGRDLHMPIDMQTELQAYVPEPKPVALATLENPPNNLKVIDQYFDYQKRRQVSEERDVDVRLCETERLAQQDLQSVLRLVNLGKVSVSDKTLMPTKATLKAVGSVLQGEDYYTKADEDPDLDYLDPIGTIKPLAWTMLLQASGFTTLEGKKLKLSKSGQKALTASPEKNLKALWKKWLKTTILDELRRVDNIKGQTGKGKRGLTAVAGRRKTIVAGLMDCPVGKWVNYGDLKSYLIASNQTFEVSRYPENLSISDSSYGYLYDTGGSWSLLETVYMSCFLFEYVATLGLIDIAYVNPYDAPRTDLDPFWGGAGLSFLSRYDGLLALRLTPLGAFCLGLTADYTAPELTTDTTLRILPNLDIVLTGQPLQPTEHMMMDTFTQQTSDAVWKLDRETALKAAAEGHDLTEFQTFLTEASADGLPNTVQQFFEDFLERTTSVQDRGLARLIECKDKTLAALIANDSRTKKFCYLAGDCHLVVPTDKETRFRTALRKVGYTLPLG
ncbi:MAG: hypothetical protein AAFY17_09130 [Cyanobacteria bacterium J06642_11]